MRKKIPSGLTQRYGWGDLQKKKKKSPGITQRFYAHFAQIWGGGELEGGGELRGYHGTLDRHHNGSPTELNKRGKVKRTNTGLPNTYRRSKLLMKLSQHPIGQNSLLIICPHFFLNRLRTQRESNRGSNSAALLTDSVQYSVRQCTRITVLLVPVVRNNKNTSLTGLPIIRFRQLVVVVCCCLHINRSGLNHT